MVTKGTGTDTVYANNQRVRVIDNRHIVIEDITPESMKGDRFFVPQAALTPYAKNDDTTGVGVYEPVAQTASIRAYPNPASDFIEIAGADGEVRIWDVLGSEQLIVNSEQGNRQNNPLTPFDKGNLRIDVSGLAPGVYFVRIGDKVSKFIKI